jgi:hypothetical protein
MALRKSQLYSAPVKYVSDKTTSQKGYLDTLSETDRNSTRRGQCGGLRHKQRHNTRCGRSARAGSYLKRW